MQNELARALAAETARVAQQLLGKPTSATRLEMRFRRKGSLSVMIGGPKGGLWFDHESGEGGGLIDLIKRECGADFRRAMVIARELVGSKPDAAPLHSNSEDHSTDESKRQNISIALRIWSEATPITRTPAERYLIEHRGLAVSALELEHALRWYPKLHAMLALMSDPLSAAPCGLHRTFLDRDARKIERKMLGRQGAIRLTADAEVTMGLTICEGIEDGLAVLIHGRRPVWAAGSAGAMSRFPVLPGIDALTIYADRDVTGLKAAATCESRWRQMGREIAVVVPGVVHHG